MTLIRRLSENLNWITNFGTFSCPFVIKMKKNLLLLVLVIIAVIALPLASYYRHESKRLARLALDLKKECDDFKDNSQLERDRQYQIARHLAAENEELKERLKACN
jgi:hypothetical protein